MVKGGFPVTFLAPPIFLPFTSLHDLVLFGQRLSYEHGALTKEGLCAFWAIVTLVLCTLVYKLSRFYSPLIFGKTYTELSISDQRQWDVRYASMPFSFLCAWYAYVVLWDCDLYYRDGELPHMLRTHATTYTELGMAIGYFIVDFAICLKYNMGGWAMHMHHVGSLMSVSAAIFNGQGHMHSTWMLLTEATTPFVNMRWWLDKADMKSSPLYLYNGIGLFLVWILARLVAFPPFFYVIWVQWEQIQLLSTYTKCLMYVFPVILIVLNVWWFSKILKGVIKLMAAPKTKRD